MGNEYKKDVESHIKAIKAESITEAPTLESLFNKRKLNEANISKMGDFQFFCWLLEAPKPNEKPELRDITDKNGSKKVWVWPYAVKFIHHCFTFLDFKRDDQSYIVAAREDKVYWRGDEISFFRTVYDNTIQWRAMSEEDKDNSKPAILARWKLVSARESRNLSNHTG